MRCGRRADDCRPPRSFLSADRGCSGFGLRPNDCDSSTGCGIRPVGFGIRLAVGDRAITSLPGGACRLGAVTAAGRALVPAFSVGGRIERLFGTVIAAERSTAATELGRYSLASPTAEDASRGAIPASPAIAVASLSGRPFGPSTGIGNRYFEGND